MFVPFLQLFGQFLIHLVIFGQHFPSEFSFNISELILALPDINSDCSKTREESLFVKSKLREWQRIIFLMQRIHSNINSQ